MAQKKRSKKCPNCNSSTDVIPILYGEPTEEAALEAKRGEIAIGGCVVFGNDPKWHCKNCNDDF